MVTIICTNVDTFITKWMIDHQFYQFFIMQTGSSYLRIIPLILSRFWKKLIHICKIHFRTISVLRVVLKSQYFWRYSRKTDFLLFTYIFQRTVTHSKIVGLTWFFSTGSGDSNKVLCHGESYHFLKFMRRKCQKLIF